MAATGAAAASGAAAAAAGAAPDAAAPTTLVKDLESPTLVGVDDRHVYWISPAPEQEGADQPRPGTGRLMRVLKTGGSAETVLEAATFRLECGFVADERRVFFIAGNPDYPDPRDEGAIVAVDRQPPHKLTRIADRRPAACHLVAAGGRLFWTESGGSASDDGPHGATARVVSAKTDGGDLRVLWRGTHAQEPRGLLVDGPRLVVALTPPERLGVSAGLGGLGELGGLGATGHGGKPPKASGDGGTITILGIPAQGGPPHPFPAISIGSPQGVALAGFDGSDLLVCAREGLFRLPRDGGGRARLGAGPPCPADLREWNGWGIFASDTGSGPLLARRLTDKASSSEVFAHIPGFTIPSLMDRDAVYACVLSAGRERGRCDLMRATAAVVAAREKEQGARDRAQQEKLAGPFRTPGDERGSPGEWAAYQPGLLTTQQVYASLGYLDSACLMDSGQTVAGLPRLVTRLFIEASGRVRDVAIVRDTYANQSFRACLVSALRGAHFPERSDGARRRIDYVYAQETTLPDDPKPNPDVEARVTKVVQAQTAKLRECGLVAAGDHEGADPREIELTLFVEPSGKVKNAAVSSPSPIADTAVGCAVRLLTKQSTSAFPGEPGARVVVPLR